MENELGKINYSQSIYGWRIKKSKRAIKEMNKRNYQTAIDFIRETQIIDSVINLVKDTDYNFTRVDLVNLLITDWVGIAYTSIPSKGFTDYKIKIKTVGKTLNICNVDYEPGILIPFEDIISINDGNIRYTKNGNKMKIELY